MVVQGAVKEATKVVVVVEAPSDSLLQTGVYQKAYLQEEQEMLSETCVQVEGSAT